MKGFIKMNIKCPHCNKEFDLNENEANELREHFRTAVFQQEVEDKVKDKIEQEIQKVTSNLKEKSQKEVSELNQKIQTMMMEAKVNKAETDAEHQKEVFEIKSDYEKQIKHLNEELAEVKEYKSRLSTKGMGEDLEVYCNNEFEQYRMIGFQNAYFGKDNKVSESGSKGDFIFRDYIDGVEFISIMFEMKNEADTTATKKTNEHFFKELDKDRKEKGCEFAVLVSRLERDNDLYNKGIVDVSYKYPKMYVIRPEFFIPMITILRNIAMNSISLKKELAEYKENNLDIVKFEKEFEDFKGKFSRNTELSMKQYEEAIKTIDDAISKLQKAKESLMSSGNNIRLANNKLIEMTTKKLAKGSPALLEQLNGDK